MLRNIIIICLFLQACSSSPQLKTEDLFQNPQPQKQQEEELPVIMEKKEKKNINVGLMLPLSGKHAELGASLFNAAKLALRDSGLESVTILPIDTEASSYAAGRSFQSFEKNDVKIVLGPVFAHKLKSLKHLAKEREIQVISFSNDESNIEKNIFLFGFSPLDQIEHIVDYEVRRGSKYLFVMLPSNAYGRLIEQELKEIQNIQIHVEFYTNQSESISLASQKVIGLLQNKAGHEVTLLVPENGENLEKILQNFRNANLDGTKITFAGSGQWEDRSILFNEDADGGIFAGGDLEARKYFEKSFRETFGHEPLRIATMAYDAMALVCSVIKEKGEFVPEQILIGQGFAGIDGSFRLKADGRTERNLSVIQVRNKEFHTIEKAKEYFDDEDDD